MTFYKDYFGIKPGYAPIMTRENIDRTPETWLAFYPHESFVEILRGLLDSLNGGGNKTHWITGAYGTGKSHASLVLQKLFTDEESRVLRWLDLRKGQIPDPVREDLLRRRREKTLVVYDVNADGVDARNQFLMRLQRGVTKSLEVNGLTIPLKGKMDDVIERVRQEGPYFFSVRDEMQSSLSHLNPGIKTSDDLERKLLNQDHDAGLISDVMRVLEKRSIYMGLAPEEFLTWVKELLKTNGISKLVYVWDEFSSFMERNRTELKTLEEIAEAAGQGQFYFVPVTHMELTSYMASGTANAKRLEDRFTFKRLDLPNETALKLAADAFVVTPEKATEWEQERDVLWHGVKGVVENYMAANNAGIDPADFKGILPVHPMAAFLLKHLSVAVGSNQRSMFEFLNGEEFNAFIGKGGLDVNDHQYLTVDHLWQYFVGRDGLVVDPAILEVRAEYARREQDLQPDEQRVFKAVLLFGLTEISQGSGIHPLLSTTVENIHRSFEGDGALQGVDAILRNLEQKHCFAIHNGRCERYRDRLDSEDVEAEKARLEKKFGELVLNDTETVLNRLLDNINYGGRFDIRAAGVSGISASSITRKQTFGPMGNQVLVQFILAQNQQEQARIREKAVELAKQFNDHRMLFVTLPEVSFCCDNEQAWEEYIDNYAREQLARRGGDNVSRGIFAALLKSAADAWQSKVKGAARLIVYKPNANGEPFAEEVTWDQLKKGWLTNYVRQTFEAYTDDLSGFYVGAFATPPTALPSWALAGIEFDRFPRAGAQKTTVTNWQKNGVTGDDAWFDENPSHPLTRLRDKCKAWQDNTVGVGNTCSIRKLYIDLQRPPYGLLGVPHSAFVLGFVLKTWLTGQRRKLQWTDGVTSKELDAETLAEMIAEVVKANGDSIKNEKLICRLSKEEKAFIEQCNRIFGGIRLVDGTVESALDAVRTRLEHISERVPLWVLPDYIHAQGDPNAEEMKKVIDALCAASSISSKGDMQTRGDKVKEIGETLLSTPGLSDAMSHYMTSVVFDEAFQQYIDRSKPELKAAAERLGDTTHRYCKAVKDRLVATSSWLWKQGDADSVLEEVFYQTLCTEQIRSLSGTSGYMSFEDAFSRLRTAVLRENRVPTEFWVRQYPALMRFFELVNRPSLVGDDIRGLDDLLKQQGEVIKDLYFDVTQARQLGAMREIFGQLWPATPEEGRLIYNAFPQDTALASEQSFRAQGRAKIEEYSRTLISKQLAALWRAHTGTESPGEWSRKHMLPAECVLILENAKSIVDAVANPAGVSAERLQDVHNELGRSGVFVDAAAAGDRFLNLVLPSRYQKIGFTLEALSNWLSQKLGDTPSRWLGDERLQGTIESFVKDGYSAHARKQAADKVSMLPDVEAKKLLLKLIDQNPDVGLSVLE